MTAHNGTRPGAETSCRRPSGQRATPIFSIRGREQRRSDNMVSIHYPQERAGRRTGDLIDTAEGPVVGRGRDRG